MSTDHKKIITNEDAELIHPNFTIGFKIIKWHQLGGYCVGIIANSGMLYNNLYNILLETSSVIGAGCEPSKIQKLTITGFWFIFEGVLLTELSKEDDIIKIKFCYDVYRRDENLLLKKKLNMCIQSCS